MTRPRGVAALLLSAAFLWLALIMPNHPAAMRSAAFLRVPLELPALLGIALCLPPWPGLARGFAWVAAVVLVSVLLVKAADFAIYESFSRPFNAVLDAFVFPSGMNLLTGAIGAVPAFGVALLAGAAVVGIGVLLYHAVRAWSRLRLSPRTRIAAGAVAVLFAGLTALDASHGARGPDTFDPPGAALSTRVAAQHAMRARDASRDLAAFRAAAESDPHAGMSGLLDRLGGRDVLVVFIESYGRSSFDNPLYSGTHVPTLVAAQQDLMTAGLGARSLWLTSPIAGGQSWLAHATLASGLHIADQARYRALLASPRRTLYHLAGEAGYRTGAVMPAITMDWPEGPRIGFETILASGRLGYAGAPFNWVTMPDQYTLAAYPSRLSDDPRPDFLQIALISSHAPWTPVAEMVPWEDVGDGRVFDAQAASGDTPRVVWKDRDRVRDQYRLAVDYALQAALSFAARQGGADAPLILMLGDHQPAPFVAGIESRDVALHAIGPPEVLALLDDWRMTEGLVPGADAPVWPMEAFRDRFVAAVTSPIGPS